MISDLDAESLRDSRAVLLAATPELSRKVLGMQLPGAGGSQWAVTAGGKVLLANNHNGLGFNVKKALEKWNDLPAALAYLEEWLRPSQSAFLEIDPMHALPCCFELLRVCWL